ncbi:interferon-induced GTP-binding protein Mx3-like [Branchiostoma lanceolatum]|uniref:interferon-induced GTP-binding protein Mx3-like n=1 Tax=Branchiostoma lanceolatum TaxID=7740 RepID=UPI003454FD94
MAAGNACLPLSLNYQEKVRPFIDLVDELRANGLDRDVSLPSVVVIGDQSAGKSSTLEAISGVQLPRGSGIVTRCPLELRLKKSQEKGAPWKGCIRYVKDKKDVRFDVDTPGNVGEAVKEAQNDLAGTTNGISDSLITLDVESPDIPDLTLIDLPGIARIAVEGQPMDIGQQIKDLISKYIQKRDTIILAVVPCNVDIATTEALKMAQEVDTDGSRTLGVLTKPDLIDLGTEKGVLEILNNEKYKLRKGYTIIKCRGQMDIDKGMSLQEAMDKEQSYFKSHEHFKFVYNEKKAGVKTLAGRLSTELVEQIKKSIPSLKEDVKTKLAATRRDLHHMGVGVPQEPNKRILFLTDLLRHFVDDLQKTAKGDLTGVHLTKPRPKKMKKTRKHLFGDARDAYKRLATTMNELMPDNGMLEAIKNAIIENRGRELPRFMCYPVCEAIIREHLLNFKDPASECLQEVSELVESVSTALSNAHFQAFQGLNWEIKGKMNELRLKHTSRAEEAVDQIFAMEKLVFTQDSIFIQSVTETEAKDKLVRSLVSACRTQSQQADEAKEAEQMLMTVYSYFKVAIQRMKDMIPMAINLHLLENLTKDITSQVNLMAAYPDQTLKLLEEDPDSAERRSMLEEKLKRLLKANQELAKFN